MKCIHCSTDSKKKDRTTGVCLKCNHPFAFEPANGGFPTDPAFEAAINRVSGKGRVRFQADHLYFEAARTSWGKGTSSGWAYLLFGFLGSFFSFMSSPWLALLVGGGFFAAWLRSKLLNNSPGLERGRFDRWLEQWKKAHGTPAGLIENKDLPALPPTKILELQSEIIQYSFDRAVICDRSETVDLLIANNFHFENNCAVLSIDGYPKPVFALVRKMLQQNPKLQIFALHDASVAGCTMAHQLATQAEWFVGQGPIVDIGLRPAHAKAFKGVWESAAPTGERPEGVTAKEWRWLKSYKLSLCTVRPEQVIKRLFRAMSQQKDQESQALVRTPQSNVVLSEVVLFTNEASASDGGGDSFG